MMNAERLFVGIQGLGIAEAANQKATAYARERLQGRSPDGSRGPVAIIEHPDVRRMLLTGRSLADASRALAIWTAMQMDIAARHPDAATRSEAEGFVALLTPVVKAAFTDFGFETAVTSQQVFGGHGYIREWGMEQFVRDARITQIYEGTNGIQALDLVTRKLPMEDGALAARFFALIEQDLRAAADIPAAGAVRDATAEALARLERSTRHLLAARAAPAEGGAAATDYLRLFALVAFGWVWVRMAARAAAGDTPLYRRKLATATVFADRVLPQTFALETAIRNGAASLMDLEADLF
ncbi:acyl-CoA dehydrogenase, partial [Hoeflea sp.]|uniref:acyl-CoA dehydrogenase n=1 Tax=Hoeflea sp. TaxID=1940281 RepID=UPI00198B029D